MASCTDKYFSVNCCRSYKEMNALFEFNLSKNLFIEGLAKSFSRKFIVSHVSLGLALGPLEHGAADHQNLLKGAYKAHKHFPLQSPSSSYKKRCTLLVICSD